MSDSSSDQKIELLVRSVLEAVDARLADVRHDIQALAGEAQRRHDDIAQRLHVLEHRVEAEMANCAGTSPVEAVDERLNMITAAIDQLRESALAARSVAAPPASVMVGLDAMSAPLNLRHITGQHPVLLDEPPHLAVADEDATMSDDVTAGPVPVTEAAIDEPTAPNAFVDEPSVDSSPAPIDLNQLADLLSERLSSISLPPR